MQVAAGRAEELEGMRPFGLMTGVFGCTRSATDPRRAAIGDLLSGAAGERNPITVTSDPGLRFRVVDALADLVEELALAGPLVIGVDDLQWADASSLLTLAALGRRAEYLPVALIACFRPSPRSPELDRLAASLEGASARYLSLGGLGAQAVADLAADAVGAAPGRGLLAGLAGAAGNPLFVTEMLAALALEGMIVLALISLHRNDIRRAREAADAAIGQYSGTATTRFRSQWALWARALILEADGSTAQAYATLAGCWDRCAELGLVLEYRMIGPDLVRMALARADQGRAREVTARVTELAEQNPGIGSLAGTALRCRGLLDDDAGALRAAADAYADGARPLELALAAEEAGAALARRGLPGQARPLLDRATEIYEQLGATRDLARAEAVLRGAGIRRGRRGSRGRPQFGGRRDRRRRAGRPAHGGARRADRTARRARGAGLQRRSYPPGPARRAEPRAALRRVRDQRPRRPDRRRPPGARHGRGGRRNHPHYRRDAGTRPGGHQPVAGQGRGAGADQAAGQRVRAGRRPRGHGDRGRRRGARGSVRPGPHRRPLLAPAQPAPAGLGARSAGGR